MLTENSKKQQTSKKRPRGRSFKPGQTGNPGGRPKLTPELIELRALAREHTRAAVEAIIAVMGDSSAPASARVSAASEVLDRGWGRATQSVEHAGPGGGVIPHEMVIEFVKSAR
jgi:hypothetical protein